MNRRASEFNLRNKLAGPDKNDETGTLQTVKGGGVYTFLDVRHFRCQRISVWNIYFPVGFGKPSVERIKSSDCAVVFPDKVA